ncbi:hypothetical protein [Gordonia sputi]
MSEPQLIITDVRGWAQGTRLYRIDEKYWLISIIDIVAVIDAVAETIGERDLTAPVRATGHCEIYQASCTETPILAPVQVSGGPEEPGVDYGHNWVSDTECVVTKDGVEYARVELQPTGDMRYSIAAIDADGDPLNGLTPFAVLPHGTTFDDALSHIQQQNEEDA